MLPKDEMPVMAPLRPIVRLAMLLGAVLIWVVLLVALVLLVCVVGGGTLIGTYFVFGYIGINLVLSLVAYRVFRRWRVGINNMLVETDKFGSARFARADELAELRTKAGFYIGGGLTFSDKGHMLMVAGTRGGKGTNLIIPNLLGLGGFNGSWVIIDPKGENAVITKRYQLESGKKVVILNPWGLLSDKLGAAQRYNTLDILADRTNVNLVDDVQMIAEMIVPINKNDKDQFFTDNARSIVAGLLLHLVTIQQVPPGASMFRLIGETNLNNRCRLRP